MAAAVRQPRKRSAQSVRVERQHPRDPGEPPKLGWHVAREEIAIKRRTENDLQMGGGGRGELMRQIEHFNASVLSFRCIRPPSPLYLIKVAQLAWKLRREASGFERDSRKVGEEPNLARHGPGEALLFPVVDDCNLSGSVDLRKSGVRHVPLPTTDGPD